MKLAVRPALPAVSPNDPAVPFKVSTPYARLLCSAPNAHGMEPQGGCALYNMVIFLHTLIDQDTPHTDEYRRLLSLMDFGSEARITQQNAQDLGDLTLAFPVLFWVPASRLLLQNLAKRALARLHAEGSVLLPCFTLHHAMYLQIDLTAADRCTLRIYNSGYEQVAANQRPRHVHRWKNKWQSMYAVREVEIGDAAGCLNVKQLTSMLRIPITKLGKPQDVADVYAWADALGTPYNPPRYAAQAEQKSGCCTHKSALAVARNQLSNAAYCEFFARLREQTYAEYMARPHAAYKQPLIDLFARRTVSARHKANAAAQQLKLRQLHAQDSWMVESTDRPAMDRALQAARARGGKAFMLSYRDDMHHLALSKADAAGITHEPLRPRGQALLSDADTYADLNAVVQAWTARGYTQVGREAVAAAGG